ncbi:hypothetical protein SFRURICE_016177, partial [Spodoptera frugiperda]
NDFVSKTIAEDWFKYTLNDSEYGGLVSHPICPDVMVMTGNRLVEQVTVTCTKKSHNMTSDILRTPKQAAIQIEEK